MATKDKVQVAEDSTGNQTEGSKLDAEPSQNGENGEAEASNNKLAKAVSTPPATSDLPNDVKLKLRKLEKLEKTYPGAWLQRTPVCPDL
jgi:hypothetical protein